MIDVTAERRLVLLAAILGAMLIGSLSILAGAGRAEDHAFVYRRDGDRHQLYSVGFDGYDDGGLRTDTPDPRRGEKRDLFFDSTLP